MVRKKIVSTATLVFVTGLMSFGQSPDEPKTTTGNFGGGFAITSGNTDTKNFNLTFAMVRDPKTRNVIKANAAYLRGDQNDILSVDRTSINLRDEYTLSGRTFAFGQVDYLRDQFKQIIFLWAPGGGLGYKLLDGENTKFAVDGGAGAIFEKNPGLLV